MNSPKGILMMCSSVPACILRLSVRNTFKNGNYAMSRSLASTSTSSDTAASSPAGGTVPPDDLSGDSVVGERASISKAMHAYLKRAKEAQELITKLEKEFVFGRRHLANMMGKDPENFTQKDIDEAIRYLFPSGLYEPKARPMMKPPLEIYPKQKAAQFDTNGRPHHPFFYTALPNFYYLLHEMVGKLNSLNKLASSVTAPLPVDKEDPLGGSIWLSKDELEGRLLEKISEDMYNEWIGCFDRIVNHPKRDKELEFIKAYRRPLAKQTKAGSLPPVTLEPDGRKSVHVPLLFKKTSRADLILTIPGTGIFKINDKGLDHFSSIQSREAVISPLQLTGLLGKVDVEANVEGGRWWGNEVPEAGETSRAITIRHGISIALAALGIDAEKLRLAGYLAQDRRRKEKKKYARDGARAKWTWKKR